MTEVGFYHPDAGYWQAVCEPDDDILAAYPEGTRRVPLKPAGNVTWDGTAWADVAPSPEDEATALAEWRSRATMTLREFIYACKSAGHIDQTEAVSLARREFPPRIQAVIDTLPLAEQERIEIDWPAASQVDRASPALAVFATAFGVDDAGLDALFIVEPPDA